MAIAAKGATARLRVLFSLALGLWALWLANHPGHFGFLDSINLAIHETGHLVFGPFGETIGALGGTLFQLVVPGAFVGYFTAKRDWYAATIPLWWLGQNCFNIATYVSDARALALPLVGGGEHDWAFLLAEWDLLHRDIAIGRAVHGVGLLICLGAAVLGAVWSGKRVRREA